VPLSERPLRVRRRVAASKPREVWWGWALVAKIDKYFMILKTMIFDQMTLVEVLERTEQAYFKADVLDVEGSNVLIKYVGETELIFVDSSRVRMLPAPMTAEERVRFNPSLGDRVEVEFVAEEGPDSWWDGKIVNLRNGTYVIEFQDGKSEIIDEKDRLRPSHGHVPVRLFKKVVPIPGDKQDSFINIDHKHQLAQINKHVSTQLTMFFHYWMN
jgi:hypothetical protein